MNNLETIRSAMQRLEGLKEVNYEVMDVDDLGDLQTTIDNLYRMLLEYRQKDYVEQLLKFKTYLDESAANNNEEEFTAWTEIPFVITHGDRTVTIDNGAEVHNHLVDMIQDELNDWI